MTPELVGAFVNLGAVGLILWWMTLKLIPQLQQERKEAITAFQEEMEKERLVHATLNQRLSDRSDKIMGLLVEHYEKDHTRSSHE